MKPKVIFGGVPGMLAGDIAKMEQYVRQEYPAVEFHFYGEDVISREELIRVGQGAKVLISWDQPMDDETYQALDLTAYCSASVGFNAANIEAASRQGVYVANVPDYCSHEVATHTISLMLALYRRFYTMFEYVKRGGWDLSPMDNITRFEESVVGLLGFGRIPQKVAQKLAGFGVTILAYDPYMSAESMAGFGVTKVELPELLARSDYLSLHSPLLPATEKMLNRETIDRMKDGACLINTARGGLVDEAALYDALVSGKIRAAGLDVLSAEPPDDMGQKLIGLDNVIVTAHSSYVSNQASDDQIRSTARNVADFLNGRIASHTLNQNKLEGA